MSRARPTGLFRICEWPISASTLLNSAAPIACRCADRVGPSRLFASIASGSVIRGYPWRRRRDDPTQADRQARRITVSPLEQRWLSPLLYVFVGTTVRDLSHPAMESSDNSFPNAVSLSRCGRCDGPTTHRLRLPDPGTSKRYDVFECRDCGQFNWIEYPSDRVAAKDGP